MNFVHAHATRPCLRFPREQHSSFPASPLDGGNPGKRSFSSTARPSRIADTGSNNPYRVHWSQLTPKKLGRVHEAPDMRAALYFTICVAIIHKYLKPRRWVSVCPLQYPENDNGTRTRKPLEIVGRFRCTRNVHSYLGCRNGKTNGRIEAS
jgi:hypothetical protein